MFAEPHFFFLLNLHVQKEGRKEVEPQKGGENSNIKVEVKRLSVCCFFAGNACLPAKRWLHREVLVVRENGETRGNPVHNG